MENTLGALMTSTVLGWSIFASSKGPSSTSVESKVMESYGLSDKSSFLSSSVLVATGFLVVTVTLQVVCLLPSAVFAVMVAVPAALGVMVPSVETVATALSLEE